MKILLMGDSITDMCRARNEVGTAQSFGTGYAFLVESELAKKYPTEHQVINRGIGGNRIVDIYARIKTDCWNLSPDLISILIGINDLWHDIALDNGVEAQRFEKIYKMYIEDTKKVLPNVKFILLEPFVLEGSATKEKYEEFLRIKEYAKITKKLAEEYGLVFVPLQERFNELAEKYGADYYLVDGVHPTVAGARVIADAYLNALKENFNI